MSTHISRRSLATHVVDRLAVADKTVLQQLAAYIVDEGLVREVDLIVDEIEAECAARGSVVADVASAHAFDDASRSQLKQFIAGATGATSVVLRETTDTQLIGGVVIETPGKYFDSSILSQLNQLKHNAKV